MNSARPALLALLFGLAIGVGIGFVLGGRPDGGVRAAPATVERGTAVSRGASPTVRDDRGAATLATVSAPDASTTASVDDGIEGAARAASAGVGARVTATFEGDDAADWTESISGTVVGPDGAPLEGATVAAQADGPSRTRLSAVRSTSSVGRAYEGPDSIDDALAERAESLIRSRRGLRTATTDAAGAFVLEGLPPGKNSLRAYADGLVFDRVEIYTGETARLKGQPVGAFRLEVLLPDGSTPDEAVVEIIEERRSQFYKWSREEPEVRLESRAANLKVLAGNVERLDWRTYASDYASKETRIELARDGEGPHVVELQARSPLRVVVSDESGLEPPLRSWVKVVPAARAEADLDSALDESEKLDRGDTAAFTAPDLAAGSYVVAVGRGEGDPEVTDTVEVTAGGTEHRVVLGAVDMERFVVARCVGPDGLPLGDVRFTYEITRESGDYSGGANATERAPGEYWLTFSGLSTAGRAEPGVKVILSADSTSYGKIERELAPDESEVLVEFRPTCSLVVQVDGDLSVGFTVSATLIEDDEDENRFNGYSYGNERTPIDETGHAELTGLQPGRYRVSLYKGSDRRSWSAPAMNEEVQVSPTGANVRFVAPSFHVVQVYAPDVEVGTTMVIQKAGDSEYTFSQDWYKEIDEEHRVVFSNVPAGDYVITCWGTTQWSQDVTVPCGEVLFEPQEINAYEVMSVEPDKLGAEAGLQKGDVVTAIDGKAFEGNTFYSLLQLGLSSGEAVVFTVQRGSTAVEISLGPIENKVNAWQAVGVNWRPRSY
ncbi:MAG: PDZ domain-containing protein [Planctomycetota bacterium]